MKRRLPPDNRLDWRDPNMPAYENGFKSPEEITRMAERRLISSNMGIGKRIFPDWRDDPSYFWASRHNRKR